MRELYNKYKFCVTQIQLIFNNVIQMGTLPTPTINLQGCDILSHEHQVCYKQIGTKG